MFQCHGGGWVYTEPADIRNRHWYTESATAPTFSPPLTTSHWQMMTHRQLLKRFWKHWPALNSSRVSVTALNCHSLFVIVFWFGALAAERLSLAEYTLIRRLTARGKHSPVTSSAWPFQVSTSISTAFVTGCFMVARNLYRIETGVSLISKYSNQVPLAFFMQNIKAQILDQKRDCFFQIHWQKYI